MNTATPVASTPRGTATQGSTSSAAQAQGQASFRAGWQALLEALGGSDAQATCTLDPSASANAVPLAGSNALPAAQTPGSQPAGGNAPQKAPGAALPAAQANAARAAQAPAAAVVTNPIALEGSSVAKTQAKSGDKSKTEISAGSKTDKSQKSDSPGPTASAVHTNASDATLITVVPTPVATPVAGPSPKAQSQTGASQNSLLSSAQNGAAVVQGPSVGPLAGSALPSAQANGAGISAANSGALQTDSQSSNTPAGSLTAVPDVASSTNQTSIHAHHGQASPEHFSNGQTQLQQIDANSSTASSSQDLLSGRKDVQSLSVPATNNAAAITAPAVSQDSTSVNLSSLNDAAAQSASSTAQTAPSPVQPIIPSATKPGTARPAAVQGLADRTAGHAQPTVDALNRDVQLSVHPGTTSAQDTVNPTLLRDSAGQAAGNAQPSNTHPQGSEPAGTLTAHDTFNALDAESGAPNTTWIHAGARHAEAGYLDPALGWIGVRAETTGGTLHASLVPGSADAAQSLSGHLEGLNKFLNEQHGTSATVTVANPSSQQSSQFGGQSMQQGSTPNQNSGQNGTPAQQTIPGVGSWRNAVRQSSATSNSPAPAVNTPSSAQAGGRISVIA